MCNWACYKPQWLLKFFQSLFVCLLQLHYLIMLFTFFKIVVSTLFIIDHCRNQMLITHSHTESMNIVKFRIHNKQYFYTCTLSSIMIFLIFHKSSKMFFFFWECNKLHTHSGSVLTHQLTKWQILGGVPHPEASLHKTAERCLCAYS